MSSRKVNIAIFCSGSGSNAEKIIQHFQHSEIATVKLLLANSPKAFALERAKNHNIPTHVFNRSEFYTTTDVLDVLVGKEIDWVVLAGFLWLVPEYLVEHFKQRMINIHPALLPKFGGKGMFGMKVHEAVVKQQEKESGITIHYINGAYDEGDIIFQASCLVDEQDTAEEVAKKVQKLEHLHFPLIIEKLIRENR